MEYITERIEGIIEDLLSDDEMDKDEIIQILSDNPKLIERPIVELNDKAIIGRPPENILDVL